MTQQYVSGQCGFRSTKLSSAILKFLQQNSRTSMRATNVVSYIFLLPIIPWFIPIAALSKKMLGQASVLPFQRFFSKMWLLIFGIDVAARYHKDINTGASYLLMFEHMHNLDMSLLGATWFNNTYGISANEFAEMPVVGSIMSISGTRFFDRHNTKQAVEDLHHISQELKEEAVNVMVAPTGTRHPSAEYLPYKKGVFHVALALGLPIVPVYMVGMETLAKDTVFSKAGKVHMVYGEPIPTSHLTNTPANINALLELTYKTMCAESMVLRKELL